MRLQLSERWPRLEESLRVLDESGALVYTVKGALLALRERLVIRDAGGTVVGELVAGWPGGGYRVTLAGREVATVSGGRRPRLVLLDGRGPAALKGRPAGREYTIEIAGRRVAVVSRRFFGLTDSYGIELDEGPDAPLVVAVAVALHRLYDRD